MDERTFKLYHLDLGFLNRAVGTRILRDSDLADERFVNEGKLAEQMAAQSLYFDGPPSQSPGLHYWLREGRAGNAEVDFLVTVDGRVMPVEVKAGKAGTLKSLIQFAKSKNVPVGCRLDLNPPSRQRVRHRHGSDEVELDLISLPLYLVGQLKRLAAVDR